MLTRIYRKLKKTFVPPTERQLRVQQWKKSDGERLRYAYDLGPQSVVFDLGGYKGQWASDIFSMYGSEVYIFEPVQSYFENIRSRFLKNSRIQVFPYGLSGEDSEKGINIHADGSSTFNYSDSGQQERIKLKKASDFFKDKGIKEIDLMKINIEGGEYDLLEHMANTDTLRLCKNIQVQFHDFVPGAEERMRKIRESLKKTHETTYCVDFVWENWRRK